MIKQEFRIVVSSQKEQKKIERLIGHIEKENAESFEWEFKHDKPNNNKFKRIEIDCGKLKLVFEVLYRKQNQFLIFIMKMLRTYTHPKSLIK